MINLYHLFFLNLTLIRKISEIFITYVRRVSDLRLTFVIPASELEWIMNEFIASVKCLIEGF